MPAALVVAVLAGWLTVPVCGADVARVDNGLETPSPVWVGQGVSFFVELKSATLFSGAPRFDVPEVSGAFLMKEEGRPVMGTERIDGQTWSTQRHNFRIYPHHAGDFNIPSFSVRFDVAPAFGEPPQSQLLSTEPFSFAARLPPGAEGFSLLISTSRLDVEEVWSPTVEDGELQLQVGDAVVRKITLLAKDVPAMALPAITMPEPGGVSAYPARPVVEDRADRGSLTGVRTDSVTFVCERAGEFVLPAIAIPWWDIDAESLQKITLPAVTVTVTAPPSSSAEDTAMGVPAAQQPDPTPWLIGAASVLVAGIFAFNFRRQITDWLAACQTRWADWQARREESEPACFQRVQRACAANDPIASYNALMHWLQKSSAAREAVTIRAVMRPQHGAILDRELTTLEQAVVSRTSSWSGRELADALERFRRTKLRSSTQQTSRADGSLPPLNPAAGDSVIRP